MVLQSDFIYFFLGTAGSDTLDTLISFSKLPSFLSLHIYLFLHENK